MVTTICGHCGDRIDGVSLEDHDDECEPECFRCGEAFEAKTDNLWHDCPERDDTNEPAPTEDRVPEDVRLERREKRRAEQARAYRRRHGLNR